MATDTLPDDVYEDSRCRLPLPKREELPADARKIFDRHGDPTGGSLAGLRGPGGIKLHSPGLVVNSTPQSHYLRYDTGLSTRVRELAILVAAREHDSRFEWSQHEPEGLRQGLSQETVDIVKYRKPVDGLDETEAVVIRFGRQLFREHRVDADVFARALAIFGAQKLVDLVALMGSYAATAALLAAFDAQLAPGETCILPVP